ncbi:MAG: beta-lactamase family protein [Anaerolineaceae bacterium]|nr:beta-lactamase family protein [Anaerolineaceae bacterium]
MMRIFDQLDPVVRLHLGDTFPACTACVIQRGQMVLNAGWGVIDPQQATSGENRVHEGTLFDLASVTKLFTTTTFLSLVSQGSVRLDDPLVTVVPEFGAINPRPMDGGQDPHSKATLPTPPELDDQTVDPAQVTFRHLLTHTSGLPPWRDVFNAAGAAPTPPDLPDPIPPETRWQRAVAALCRYPFVGQPDGVTVRYSDVGLLLLGEAIRRLDTASDKPSFIPPGAEQLGTLLYNPVRDHGISREGIAPTEDDPVWRGRRVWGEVHDENACGVGGIAGHAGLFATASTVARFGQAWLEGASAFGITPDVWREATREQVAYQGTRRGLGWALKAGADSMAGDLMSMDAYGHSGFTGTTLWIDSTHDLVITLLTNRVYPGRWHTGTHGGIHAFRRAAHDTIVETCMTGTN